MHTYHYWNVKWEARVSNCCERDSGSDLQMVLLLKFTTSKQCCNNPKTNCLVRSSSKNPACISSVMVNTHFYSLQELLPPVARYFFYTAKCSFWKAASEDQWNLLYHLHCYMYYTITAASAYSHMPAMWYYTVEPPLTDTPNTGHLAYVATWCCSGWSSIDTTLKNTHKCRHLAIL